MKIKTLRFGELEIAEQNIFFMPEGLVGLDHARRFCVLEEAPGSPIKWLQVIDEPALAFVAINPYDFYPDYEFEVCGKDAELVGLDGSEEAAVLVLLTIGSEGREVTANLVAPVVVGMKARMAKQVILQNDKYSTKHLLCSASHTGAQSR